MTSTTCGGRRNPNLRRRIAAGVLVTFALLAAGCGDDDSPSASGRDDETTLVIGGIPDQDPERLQRQFGLVADRFSDELGIDVVYEPVAEYDAAVSAFRVGDLDLVWFGGLTGVQARLQVDGARAIAQRDIDEHFTSVFIARSDADIEPFESVDGLTAFVGRSFTFGSDSSTSGRLMPQYFLEQAGVSLGDLAGEPGFSGSHDATIELVKSGSFDGGVLNSQVWDARVEAREVDTDEIVEVFRTPEYYDYHWVVRPELGEDLIRDIVDVLLSLDSDDPDDAAILELFGAGSFIATEDANYGAIEAIGREIGKID